MSSSGPQPGGSKIDYLQYHWFINYIYLSRQGTTVATAIYEPRGAQIQDEREFSPALGCVPSQYHN